jgi:hypothetical protein
LLSVAVEQAAPVGKEAAAGVVGVVLYITHRFLSYLVLFIR